jgi:hypothetical protein
MATKLHSKFHKKPQQTSFLYFPEEELTTSFKGLLNEYLAGADEADIITLAKALIGSVEEHVFIPSPELADLQEQLTAANAELQTARDSLAALQKQAAAVTASSYWSIWNSSPGKSSTLNNALVRGLSAAGESLKSNDPGNPHTPHQLAFKVQLPKAIPTGSKSAGVALLVSKPETFKLIDGEDLTIGGFAARCKGVKEANSIMARAAMLKAILGSQYDTIVKTLEGYTWPEPKK